MKNLVVDIRKQNLGLMEGTLRSLFEVEISSDLFVWIIYNNISSREIKELVKIFKEFDFTNFKLISFKAILSKIGNQEFLEKKEREFYLSEFLLLFMPHFFSEINNFHWISSPIYFNERCLDEIKINSKTKNIGAFPLSIRLSGEIENYMIKSTNFMQSYLKDYHNQWMINTNFGLIDVQKFIKKFSISYLFDYLGSVSYLNNPALVLNFILYDYSLILKPDYLCDYSAERKTYKKLVKKSKKVFNFKYDNNPCLIEIRPEILKSSKIDNYHFEFYSLIECHTTDLSTGEISNNDNIYDEINIKKIKELVKRKLTNHPRLYRLARFFYRFKLSNE